MNKIKQWLRPRYKIVPTYTADNQINGYMPLKYAFIDYVRMPMLQMDIDGTFKETDAWFKSYEDALNFLKHETKIINDEEISDTENA